MQLAAAGQLLCAGSHDATIPSSCSRVIWLATGASSIDSALPKLQRPITCGMQADLAAQMQLHSRARSRHPPELAAFGADCRCWVVGPTLGLGMRLTKSFSSTLKSRLPPLGMSAASASRGWLSELSVDL